MLFISNYRNVSLLCGNAEEGFMKILQNNLIEI